MVAGTAGLVPGRLAILGRGARAQGEDANQTGENSPSVHFSSRYPKIGFRFWPWGPLGMGLSLEPEVLPDMRSAKNECGGANIGVPRR
jgi:hypothetical protein